MNAVDINTGSLTKVILKSSHHSHSINAVHAQVIDKVGLWCNLEGCGTGSLI